MIVSLEQVTANALALPPEQRELLAERLWDSIAATEEDGAPLGPSWDEVNHRIKEIEDGTAQTIPAEEVFARLREKYD